MPDYKAVCKVDKELGSGTESHTLYVRNQDNEGEAERTAKYYCMLDQNWTFYGAEVTIIK